MGSICLSHNAVSNKWWHGYLDHNMFQSNQPDIGTFLHPRYSREDKPGYRGAFDALTQDSWNYEFPDRKAWRD